MMARKAYSFMVEVLYLQRYLHNTKKAGNAGFFVYSV